MASQESIISYVPQPFFTDTFGPPAISILGTSDIDSVENAAGLYDPDLSNYTTFNVTKDSQIFKFSVTGISGIEYPSYYTSTLALIGFALKTYEDSGGSPDLATEFYEPVNCLVDDGLEVNDTYHYWTYSHNSPNAITTWDREPLPGIIAGGTANLVFGSLPGPPYAGGSDFEFIRDPANVTARPHAVMIVGHMFRGVDIKIDIDPTSFAWSIEAENQRFRSRAAGAISSEGTLIRRSSGQIRHIMQDDFTGAPVTGVGVDGEQTVYRPYPEVDPVANFFDMIKSNNSYPLLFNPYPKLLQQTKGNAANFTAEDYNYSARQNFFSIYGFMDGGFELTPSEYRDGLDSEYKARFRIQETR